MILPFRQLPELLPKTLTLVGGEAGSGKTFFLTTIAREALSQKLKVCYIGFQDGNVWLYELVQPKYEGFSFVNLEGQAIPVNQFIDLIKTALNYDVAIFDGLDRINDFTSEINKKGTINKCCLIVGLPSQHQYSNAPPDQNTENHDSLPLINQSRVIPIVVNKNPNCTLIYLKKEKHDNPQGNFSLARR